MEVLSLPSQSVFPSPPPPPFPPPPLLLPPPPPPSPFPLRLLLTYVGMRTSLEGKQASVVRVSHTPNRPTSRKSAMVRTVIVEPEDPDNHATTRR